MGAATHLIPGPVGLLEVLEEQTQLDPVAVAVVCHPHPLHGGTLRNKVVHQLARSFLTLGATSIRLNFRGVGDSQGQFDHGRGERDDLVAVTEWAVQRWPGRPLWLAGFSFGAAVAMSATDALNPSWLVTVAPAFKYLAADWRSPTGTPWLLIQGGDDDVVSTSELSSWVEGLEPKPHMVVLDSVGHFFHGRLNDLRNIILEGAPAAS
jgi:hypothetical protein